MGELIYYLNTLANPADSGEGASPLSKKAKKHAHKAASAPEYPDTEALNRRAMRFSREHTIERQKSLANGGQTSLQTNSHHSHLSNNGASRSASLYMNVDDPEVDPVSSILTLSRW